MRQDAEFIIKEAIHHVLPDEAVVRALQSKQFDSGQLIVVSVGKAGWQMAKAASDTLKDKITEGYVITKYDHIHYELPTFRCFEAGHPVPDDNSYQATETVLNATSNLNQKDTVLFLLSGGGSALFEKPLIQSDELQDITKQLLNCGAEITEINTIRKRLSSVKGGKFAQHCAPAQVCSIVLSDIVGDPLDMIASGPAYPDSSTSEDALSIVSKYNLILSDQAVQMLKKETPKELKNIETVITGSVKNLCLAAKTAAEQLGYETTILTTECCCEAKDAGKSLAQIALKHQSTQKSLAFISGGETVVHITGKGKGGRNQELALATAEILSHCNDTCLFSVGSDGTDGPTDAAGGYVDTLTYATLRQQGIDINQVLLDNDSYHALQKANGLIFTGPTGTNVNDVSVLLIKR